MDTIGITNLANHAVNQINYVTFCKEKWPEKMPGDEVQVSG